MHDFLGRQVEIGDYLFGGIGYGNVIWIVTHEKQDREDETYGRGCMAKLANRSMNYESDATSVNIDLDQFVKISKEDITLYLLQRI